MGTDSILLEKLILEIKRLGLNNASTEMGALEALSVSVEKAGGLIETGLFILSEKHQEGLQEIALAIKDHAEAIREVSWIFEKKFGVQPEEEK